MQFIHSTDGHEGVEALAAKLVNELMHGKHILWLICGGSNIPLAKQVMNIVRASAGEQIHNLSIGQTDERFGPVGHKDSNMQQMLEASFNFEGGEWLPILRDLPLEATAQAYAAELMVALGKADVVVGQFGIGADGHVAGMLPHTPGIGASEYVVGYESSPFVRLTMTPPAIAHLAAAYVFAFGDAKRDAIEKLRTQELPLQEEPCQILKTIPECYFYTDQ